MLLEHIASIIGEEPDIWRRVEFLEATSGFEPEIKVLQTSALPLGYVASRIVIIR